MIYLDTSALVKLHVLEFGTDVVSELVATQSEPLPVWEIQEMELINALRLKVFWGTITESEATGQIGLFEARKARGQLFFPDLDRAALSDDYKRLSALTPLTGCRTLDILHVACALQLFPDLFVTFDSRQRNLAKEAGLHVFEPPVQGS